MADPLVQAATAVATAIELRKEASDQIRVIRSLSAAAAAAQAAITARLAAFAVPHRWVGTRLDLLGADGTYIEGPDLKGLKGDKGGAGLPAGGTAGQVARKLSGEDYASEWHTLDKGDVGLSNADNTSDADKPISDDVQAALDDIAGAMAYGTAALTAAANGNATITHGLGFAPTFATVSILGDQTTQIDVQAISSTTITVRFRDAAGADVTSGAFNVLWEARI